MLSQRMAVIKALNSSDYKVHDDQPLADPVSSSTGKACHSDRNEDKSRDFWLDNILNNFNEGEERLRKSKEKGADL